MGQKVNPHGLRVGVIKDWDSRWYARDEKVGDLIVEDYNIRKYLKKTLYAAGIPSIEIERSAGKVRINIHCCRPGVVIGKGGTEIEKLRLQDGEPCWASPWLSTSSRSRAPTSTRSWSPRTSLQQLEKRIGFRRAMKQAMQRATRLGAKGIKVTRAPAVWAAPRSPAASSYHEGTIPLQTLRADIDYGFAEANTTYGTHRRQGLDLQGRGAQQHPA